MVNINLRRFSRSKVDDENTNIINPELDQEIEEPKKRRGRPPKSVKNQLKR